MIKGFKEFIMRGNVLDLAVAVVIGAAFVRIVQALLDGLINPIIAAMFGKPDLRGVLAFTINDARFSVGLFLDALINFLIIATAIYFLVVLPVNILLERRRAGQEPEPEPLTIDQQLLTEIRDRLRARD